MSQQDTIPTRNLAIAIITGFGVIIAFIIAVLLISKLGVQEGSESTSLVYERIKPVGQVKVEGAVQVAQAPDEPVASPDASQPAPESSASPTPEPVASPDASQPAPESPTSPTETPDSSESTSYDEAKGEQVYNTACFVCHGLGVAGAPKFGDQAGWAPRIAKGMEVLFSHALQGFQAMPAKGGQTQLPDEDVKAAVSYMVSKSQ